MGRTESEAAFDADATASEAVVAAVAARAGVESTDLPPLYAAADPDALDALFEGGKPSRVSFEYAGYDVTVCGRDQVIVICEPVPGSDAATTRSDT